MSNKIYQKLNKYAAQKLDFYCWVGSRMWSMSCTGCLKYIVLCPHFHSSRNNGFSFQAVWQLFNKFAFLKLLHCTLKSRCHKIPGLFVWRHFIHFSLSGLLCVAGGVVYACVLSPSFWLSQNLRPGGQERQRKVKI